MRVVYTEEAFSSRFAAMDIARKAEVAVERHPELFTSPDHLTQVFEVQKITKKYLQSYGAIFQTARIATRKRPAHTELKFAYVSFPSKNRDVLLKNFRDDLEKLRIDPDQQVVSKPNTASLSIHIY